MCEVITAEQASLVIKDCEAEWDRLADLKVESTDLWRMTECEKNTVIGTIFDLLTRIREEAQYQCER